MEPVSTGMDDDENVEMRAVNSRSWLSRQPMMISRSVVDSELHEQENRFNTYATSKSVSQNMLNMTTIQALIVSMVRIFQLYTPEIGLDPFQIASLTLISVSLTLQFIIFVLLVILAKSTAGNEKITRINNAVTSLSGLLLIVSSAISVLAFSTSPAVESGNTNSTG